MDIISYLSMFMPMGLIMILISAILPLIIIIGIGIAIARMNNDNTKTTPKDFFLYLGIAITLYVAAGSLLALLFGIININFPDLVTLNYYDYYAPTPLEMLRFPLSFLFVVFPIFLLLAWYARKELAREPSKADVWVRRWFVWLTLFIAGATLVGDIVALLNTYLGGELAIRFVLKMLSVFVVAAAIFGYYFYDLRRTARGDTSVNKPLIIVAILAVVAVVIAGFVSVGSPTRQRELRFDRQRVEDLRNIQWQIRDYWQGHQKLPPAQDDLLDAIGGNVVPKDPETGESYEYKIAGPLSFELCATFATSNVPPKPLTRKEEVSKIMREGGDPDEYFEHGIGHVCFARTIDPERYPPYPKI